MPVAAEPPLTQSDSASHSADTLRADAHRRVVSRAMLIGVWVWPAFTLMDAWMSFVAYPGAPFRLFLLYRVIVEAALLVTYRASLRPHARIRWIVMGQNLSFAMAATAIALMATALGGVRSPYMHGISIVALVRAVVIPEAWRRAWLHFAVIGLVFPVVMFTGTLLSSAARSSWLTDDALIVFASNYVFVVVSALIGLIGSNMVWRAQQQLYRARRIGRYRLKAPIGRGGMGEVWLAWDELLQRNVALKLLRASAETGPQAVARFEREALAASQLNSPHVVQIFDYGASEDGLYYIAMEFLTGVDLQTLVDREGPVPPARAVHIIMQACRALEIAHAAGVIHRDIKPNNLFVCRSDGEDDVIKLLDFGIVRWREPSGSDLTRTGVLIGTPPYIAPERWMGAEADERSDLYSLGVTLHFLLSARQLTPAAPETPVLSYLGPQPLFGNDSSSELKDLERIVRWCLATDPSDRVPSARDLHTALAALHARLAELHHGGHASPAATVARPSGSPAAIKS